MHYLLTFLPKKTYSHFLFNKEPVALKLFTSRCTVDFEGNETPKSRIMNLLRHSLQYSFLTYISTIKNPQYCTTLIFTYIDNRALHVTLDIIVTNKQEHFTSDGRSL